MVKPGYKQTEIGVIPEDWDSINLNEIGTFSKGKGIKKTDVVENGLPCIRYGELYTHYDDVIRKFYSYIPYEIALGSKKLKKGDILFAGSGETAEEIGKCAAYVGDEEAYAGGDIVIFTPIDQDEMYLGYLLNSHVTMKQKERLGQGDAVVHISSSSLGQLIVPIPPLPEQKAIASTLNDVDALIGSLERLIAKKRDIKRAAMRKLLDPGQAWMKRRLGDTSIIKARIGWQGLTTAEYLESGNYFLVTGTDFENGFIGWGNCHYVDESRYLQDRHIQLKQHDILVTKDGTIGKVAFVDELQRPATLNSGIFVVRPVNGAFEPEFFYHLMHSGMFSKFLDQLSAGSTINHLYQKDFVNFEYQIPETLSEQKNIAATLTAMDKEISAINRRLEKTRELKQGMMQELLTGRIRLV